MDQVFSAEQWWATPVLHVDNRNSNLFNERLRAIILREEQELTARGGEPQPVAGVERGLTAHWHEYNVLNWPYPECRELRRLVLEGARRYLAMVGDPDDPRLAILGIASWANVLRHGESMHIHHHEQAFMNAHYIVCAGDDVAAGGDGATIYYRPGFMERSHGERRGPVLNPWDADWLVRLPPQAGRFMFFPGFVRHEVRPYLGRSERISLAFDFYLRGQEPLIHFGGERWFVPGQD